MKIRHKTLMYRIDNITLVDLDDLIEEACADGVPSNASVVVRIDGSGCHITFEWAGQTVVKSPYAEYKPNAEYKSKVSKPDKSKWYKEKPYFNGESKPYKQL